MSGRVQNKRRKNKFTFADDPARIKLHIYIYLSIDIYIYICILNFLFYTRLRSIFVNSESPDEVEEAILYSYNMVVR